MLPATARLVLGIGLALVASSLAKSRAAADEPAADAAADPLAAIVAAVQTEEVKYRDVEYSLQITGRKHDPTAADRPGEITTQEKRDVVLQGALIHFQRQVFEQAFKRKFEGQEISAFDGQQTRTVVSGNSVNIHLGRFEHPDVHPAHSVPLIHYKLNFPLSVYLRGTEAIHSHPKYPHFARPSGELISFAKVEARVEGEEQLDGLRCVKIHCQRWYHADGKPDVQSLWLCPERNYHCLKEQLCRPVPFGDLPLHEMRVESLHEAAPGLWFPAKVVVDNFDGEALREKKLVVALRTQTLVEKVSLVPRHDEAFFREVAIPADMPVFTIKDGALVGSHLAEPIADAAEEQQKLQETVARVHEEEQRYAELAATVRVRYQHVHPDLFLEGLMTEIAREERSVLQDGLGYFASHGHYYTAGGQRAEQDQIQAFDGEWTRSLYQTRPDGKEPQRSVALRKGGGGKAEGRHDGVPVYRPHTFLVRDDWLYGPLADLLVSPWHDKINKYRIRFRYCGEDQLDGHPCVKLRDEVTTREGAPPHNYSVYWLATDRNYIPIRMENYGGNFGLQPLPTGISYCDNFRELAPGVWYPFRATHYAFHHLDLMQRRLVLNWRRVHDVVSAELAPPIDEGLFKQVVASAGTKINVSDDDARFLGSIVQEHEGPPEITPSQYLALQSTAKLRDDERQVRQQAIQALVGKAAPEFSENATWLNGRPLDWQALRGKFVVLNFWAEWCGPCRNDFPQLRVAHDHRESIGLTIIGIHPPGSELKSIRKVIDEFHLDYPTCIDVPAREGVKAWGDLFGQYAVHAIPHAVAVDPMGVIVACGPLNDVFTAAIEAVKKAKADGPK